MDIKTVPHPPYSIDLAPDDFCLFPDLRSCRRYETIEDMKEAVTKVIDMLKVTHEPITRIISKQLDIKLGPFTLEELDSVLRKIQDKKAAGLDVIPPEVWKTRQFDDILLRHCYIVYYQNPIDRWMKGYIPPFPKNGITLTPKAVKIYNALLRNRIEPKITTFFGRTKMASREIDPRPHKY